LVAIKRPPIGPLRGRKARQAAPQKTGLCGAPRSRAPAPPAVEAVCGVTKRPPLVPFRGRIARQVWLLRTPSIPCARTGGNFVERIAVVPRPPRSGTLWYRVQGHIVLLGHNNTLNVSRAGSGANPRTGGATHRRGSRRLCKTAVTQTTRSFG
jgi:hypothetical protein